MSVVEREQAINSVLTSGIDLHEECALRSSCREVRSLFLNGLPQASRDRARLLWLTNFECEQFWTTSETVRLPSFSSSAETAIVNRMEEMCLWLAGEPDIVVLREAPDPEFISYLEQIGMALPRIVTARSERPSDSISRAVLNREEHLRKLISLRGTDYGLHLLAYGNTALEEEISRLTGIPLLGSGEVVCAKVNSKIFSRRLSQRLGLPTVSGYECESLEELEEGFRQMRPRVSAGSKIVLKEAMGVSGKGLLVFEQTSKMDQILELFRRQHKPSRRYAFVVEQWIEKEKDINYQILISPTGDVQFLAIKESFTRGAVHAGHRCPPELTAEQLDFYRSTALMVGKELYHAGFVGIAGIDSMLDPSGNIYPILEINARFNMSTYQLALERTLERDSRFVVKNYPLLLEKPLRFQDLAEGLGGSLFGLNGCMRGVGIMCFATVNCNVKPSVKQAKGRLYVVIAGKSLSEIDFLDLKTQKSLQACGVTVSAR